MNLLYFILFFVSSISFASNGILQTASTYTDFETREIRQVVGTGLVFNYENKSYALTASHVVSGTDLVIQYENSQLDVARIKYVNRVVDVALFELKGIVNTPFQLDDNNLKITANYSEFARTKTPTLAIDTKHFAPVLYTIKTTKPYSSPEKEILSFSKADNSSKNQITETTNGLELRAYAGIKPGMSGSPLLEFNSRLGIITVKGVTTSYNNFFRISYFSKIENALSAFFPPFAPKLTIDANWYLSSTGFFRVFSNGYSENKSISNRAGNSLIVKNNAIQKLVADKKMNPQIKFEKLDPNKKVDAKSLLREGGVRSDGGGNLIMQIDDPQVTYYDSKTQKYNTDQFTDLVIQAKKNPPSPKETPASWSRTWSDIGFKKEGQNIIGFDVTFKNGQRLSLIANENSLIFLDLQKDRIESVRDVLHKTNFSHLAEIRWAGSPDGQPSDYHRSRGLSYCHAMAMSLKDGDFDISVFLFNKKTRLFWSAFPIMSSTDTSAKYEDSIITRRTFNGEYSGDDYDITGLYFTDLSLFDRENFSIRNASRMYLYFSSKSQNTLGGEGKVFCETRKDLR